MTPAQPSVIRIDRTNFEFISRATIELSHAMGRMAQLGPSIAFIGSNHITHDSPHKKYYDLAVEIAEVMGGEGWNCLTGGGSGITEAAILGAGLGKARSAAMRLVTTELKVSRKPDIYIPITNPFNRKVLFDLFAEAYIFFPGGFGTLDLLFEALTLQQTRKIETKPIICVGEKFWKNLLTPLFDRCLKPGYQTISPEDCNLLHITDNYRDIARIVWQHRGEVMQTKGPKGLPQARSGSSVRSQAFANKTAVELGLAFNTFLGVGDGITFFGSARSKPGNKLYEETVALAQQLGTMLVQRRKHSQKRGAIITGGGPGNMEAANKGARLAGAPSLGLGIDLPMEQGFNPYVDPDLSFEFKYFFCRKWLFCALTDVLVVTPGGFGTFDELFEMLASKQYFLKNNAHLVPKSIFCVNRRFWEEPLGSIMEHLLSHEFIASEHQQFIHYQLDADEVLKKIQESLNHVV